jgi:hypothetical protein
MGFLKASPEESPGSFLNLISPELINVNFKPIPRHALNSGINLN